MTAHHYGKSRPGRNTDTPVRGSGDALTHALGRLLDPASGPAEQRAAARVLDRAQTTALSTLPLHRALGHRVRRLLRPAPGQRLLARLLASGPAAEAARALALAPGLEPLPAGAPRLQQVPLRLLRAPGPSVAVRQGRLGDCWLIAVLDACEAIRPGFLRELIRPDADPRFATVRLHSPALALPLLRRIPGLPLRPREVRLSTAVPRDRRAGSRTLAPNAASLAEKAAVCLWAQGSYRRLARDFAGIAFVLVTGRWAPARPVPRRLETMERWLAQGRPVVASTLIRPGGSFTLAREDDPGRRVAVMDGHVYAVHGVGHSDEDGRAVAGAPLRVHLRNPVGPADPPAPSSRGMGESVVRRKDLYLSARQLRRAFISVNVGPRLR